MVGLGTRVITMDIARAGSGYQLGILGDDFVPIRGLQGGTRRMESFGARVERIGTFSGDIYRALIMARKKISGRKIAG